MGTISSDLFTIKNSPFFGKMKRLPLICWQLHIHWVWKTDNLHSQDQMRPCPQIKIQGFLFGDHQGQCGCVSWKCLCLNRYLYKNQLDRISETMFLKVTKIQFYFFMKWWKFMKLDHWGFVTQITAKLGKDPNHMG